LNRLGRAGPGGPGFGRGPARRTGSPRARSELAAGMPPAARGCHEPGGPARAGPTGRPQDTSHQGRAARSLLKSQGRLKGREGRPPHKLLLETSHRRGRRRSACSKARPEARWHERTHARTLARWSLARARSGGGCHAPIGADSAATTSTRSSPPLERYSHPPCDLHHWLTTGPSTSGQRPGHHSHRTSARSQVSRPEPTPKGTQSAGAEPVPASSFTTAGSCS